MSKLLPALAAAALIAAVSGGGPPTPQAVPIVKFDKALREWTQRPTTPRMRVLVQARPGTGVRVLDRLKRVGVASPRLASTSDLLVADLTPAAATSVAANDEVLRMSVDAVIRSFGTAATYLSGNRLLATEALLPRQYSGANIGVAVIDSGFLPSADFGKITASYIFNNGLAIKQGPKDPYGHGTHVAGLIGSTGSTSSGEYQGIAPGTRLTILRVLDANGTGYTSDVIAAIDFAVAQRAKFGIDILNLSLGHPIYEPAANDPLVQAVERAAAAGIVVVVAAGNFGGDPVTHEAGYGGITSPGNAPSAITVGAIDPEGTAARGDDTIAWYSSRGPTWYDGFQKPDLVAPGSHLVSDVPTTSMIARSYPAGLIVAKGTCNLSQLSGTSMAAGVVSGVVSLMLEASRASHPGARLTPAAVKAILQYTAFDMPAYDQLTQGAGALNAAGAVELAKAIDPGQPLGSWWLTRSVDPATTVAGERVAWSQRVVWGDRVIWGNQIFTNDPAWGLRVVWGDRVIWGNRVVWGNSTVWDGNQLTWGSRVVWGNTLIGETQGASITWGSLSSEVSASGVVWGDLSGLNIAPTSLSWGNVERANGDLVQR